MKNLLTILLLSIMVSCSSHTLRDDIVHRQEKLEDTDRQDKTIGDSLPSWVYKSGIEDGMVFAVGKAEASADKSPFFIEKVAQLDAEVRLLSDAPSDFRILTQNAMTGAGIDSSEFYQIQTKLQEVVGVVGIQVNQEKVTCRVIIRQGQISARRVRACFVQAYIPVKELTKAYQRTLAIKFGDYKANEFKNLMAQELQRVLKNPLVTKDKGHEFKQTNNTSNTNSAIKSSESTRLPAEEAPTLKK